MKRQVITECNGFSDIIFIKITVILLFGIIKIWRALGVKNAKY